MTLIAIILLVAILVVVTLIYLKRHPVQELHPTPNGQNYIGKVFTLEFPVINGTGILQVDHTTWRLNCPDLPAGSRVRITGKEGMILLAEPNHSS